MTVCGDGGMITTNNEKIASIVYKLRDCGRKSQYIHDVIGYTSRLNTVNAAVGRIQLKRLDAWIEKRRKIADVYHRLLGGIKDLTLPPKGSTDVQPVYHLYVIRTKQRDQLKQHLETSGVSCGVHYALPIHLQPVYQEMYGFTEGVYPNAEQLCKTCLSLPMYPDLSQKEIEVIADSVCSFFS
jgi:dTDP-4-amino-4,6-dideoxygalactose transaminase